MFSARFLLLWARWIGIESPFKTQVIKLLGKTSIWVFEHCLGRKKQKLSFGPSGTRNVVRFPGQVLQHQGPQQPVGPHTTPNASATGETCGGGFKLVFVLALFWPLTLDHEKPAVVDIANTSFIWYVSSISLPAIVIYTSYMRYFLTSCFTSTCIS